MNLRMLALGLVVLAVMAVTGCSSCCHKTSSCGAPPCGCPGPLPAPPGPSGAVVTPPVVSSSGLAGCPNCVTRSR
jgi:hypothetical protein